MFSMQSEPAPAGPNATNYVPCAAGEIQQAQVEICVRIPAYGAQEAKRLLLSSTVSSSAHCEQIIAAIESALREVQAASHAVNDDSPVETAGLIGLSSREHSVIELISKGCSYRESASILGVSTETIGAHLRNAYRKLGVHSKNEAVFEAHRLGLLTTF